MANSFSAGSHKLARHSTCHARPHCVLILPVCAGYQFHNSVFCGALLLSTLLKCESRSRQVSAVHFCMHAAYQICGWAVYVVCRQSCLIAAQKGLLLFFGVFILAKGM